MRAVWWAAAVSAALVATPAYALRPDKSLAQCSVQVWDVKNGLPGAAVRALAQAPDGALWVGTLGGVVRFDGTRFTPLPASPELAAIANDSTRILAASDGTIYFGYTFREPLWLSGSVLHRFGPEAGLPPRFVPMAWVEGARGEIWMAGEKTLVRLAGGRFMAQGSLAGLEPTALEHDRGGGLWLGTSGGLYTLAGGVLVPWRAVTGAVSALHRDRRGVLWVAAPGVLVGLDGARTVEVRDPALAGPVSQIDDDEDGNLWLGTPGGLVRVREQSVARFTARDGLPGDEVTAVLVDREGSLWIGSRDGGLAQVTDRTLDTGGLPAILQGVQVHSVSQDGEGALWFGTRGRGAVRWQDGVSTAYADSSVVYSVCPGGDNDVWIGSAEGLSRWRAGQVSPVALWRRPVRALFRGAGGALWIGGDGELGRLANGALERFGKAQGMLGGQVRAMGEDGAGRLWVSAVGGLVRLEQGKLVRLSPTPGRRSGFVRSMLTDHEGALWLSATQAGLVRVQGSRFTAYDALLEEGLPYQVLEDDAGDLWLGTNRSVVRVSRASLERPAGGLEVTSFDTTDRRGGVVAETARQPAAWKARDGRLWFVTQQGVVSVDPARVRSSAAAATPVIEAVLADGRELGAAPLPRGGRIQLQLGAVALLQPSRVRFRYRLEGVDADWVQAGARRTATYAALPPGPHRFRLQVSNSDGVWSRQEAAFAFTVAPPFYWRVWFYALCAVGLVPLGWALHRARVMRLRAQYVGTLTERARVARELHDTVLQELTAISLQLRTHRARLAGARAQEAMRIQDAVARCLRDAREAVRGLRSSDGPSGLGRLGQALSRLARRLRDSSDVSCEVKVEGAPAALPETVEEELFRIGQEAITNALKHARASRVDVRLGYGDGRLVLNVTDDGCGFDPQEPGRSGHFGLVGMRERAQQIGAELTIRSEPEAGTVIEVSVKHE